MGSERGQATVEWVGLLLLVTLALLALTRLAPRAEDRSLGTTLASSITTTAKRTAASPREVDPRRFGLPHPPPLARPGPRWLAPDSRRVLLQGPRRAGILPGLRLPRPGAGGRAARGVRGVWRRAWFACLVWERVKYSLLHPEARIPGYTFPYDVVLKIVARCVSPVDVFRDVAQLEQRP
jgi:hypothetical protein